MLPGEVEECFVVPVVNFRNPNGTSDAARHLMLRGSGRRPPGGEEAARVQRSVSLAIEQAAVNLVLTRAALHNDCGDFAELGRVIANPELNVAQGFKGDFGLWTRLVSEGI